MVRSFGNSNWRFLGTTFTIIAVIIGNERFRGHCASVVIKYWFSRWCRSVCCSLPVTVCQEIPVDDDLLYLLVCSRHAASPFVPIYVRMDDSTIDRTFPSSRPLGNSYCPFCCARCSLPLPFLFLLFIAVLFISRLNQAILNCRLDYRCWLYFHWLNLKIVTLIRKKIVRLHLCITRRKMLKVLICLKFTFLRIKFSMSILFYRRFIYFLFKSRF